MSFLSGFFKDGDGAPSMMRLLSLLALLIGAGLAFSGHDSSVSIFVISAFGGKVAQKFAE